MKDIELSYWHKGINLETFNDLMRMYKTKKFSKAQAREYVGCGQSTDPKYFATLKEFEDNYDSVEPFNKEELEKLFVPYDLECLGFNITPQGELCDFN